MCMVRRHKLVRCPLLFQLRGRVRDSLHRLWVGSTMNCPLEECAFEADTYKTLWEHLEEIHDWEVEW